MIQWLTRWASGLRFPTLLAVIAALFLLDLVIPDMIPLADELLLGLLAVALASLRKRRSGEGADLDSVKGRDGSSPRDR